MAIYFFDTSALVKRYVHETGSGWVGQVTDPKSGNKIYMTTITGVEVISAIMKNVRNTSSPLPLGDAQKAISAQSAQQGIPATGIPSLVLVASDDDLLAAAQAEGLAVDDPRNHP